MNQNTQTKNPAKRDDAPTCLSEYGLDRHMLQLESDDQKEHSLRHIASCTDCQRDVDAWHQAQAVPVVLPAAPSVWQQLVDGWASALFGPAMATFAAAAVAVLVWKNVSPHPQPAPIPGEPRLVDPVTRPLVAPRWRIKGTSQPGLLVKRTRKGQRTTLEHRGAFLLGDDVQIKFRWLAGRFVFVLHRDTKGVLSPLHPARKEAKSAPIHQGGFQSLPDSFSVSGAVTGDEEIWACFTRKALTFKDVVQQLRKHRPHHKGDTAQVSKQSEVSGASPSSDCAWLRFVMKRPTKPSTP